MDGGIEDRESRKRERERERERVTQKDGEEERAITQKWKTSDRPL